MLTHEARGGLGEGVGYEGGSESGVEGEEEGEEAKGSDPAFSRQLILCLFNPRLSTAPKAAKRVHLNKKRDQYEGLA